ncbi:hypothetical protein PIROE2DRAFT_63037 [Piromyces sp. E2]|nr:hypothetical protein PIROE2DRAFT_63037 [Piromyces sp. E2]|eukprot:OUM60612.1 hypothetical protein PIROE2DRAFT_63037 [Piromyces sp. E2]
MPGGTEGISGSCLGGFNVGIQNNLNESKLKAALKAVEYMTSEEVQKEIVSEYNILSGIASVYDDEKVCSKVDCEIYKNLQPIARPTLDTDNYDEYSVEIRQYAYDINEIKTLNGKNYQVCQAKNFFIKSIEFIFAVIHILKMSTTLILIFLEWGIKDIHNDINVFVYVIYINSVLIIAIFFIFPLIKTNDYILFFAINQGSYLIYVLTNFFFLYELRIVSYFIKEYSKKDEILEDINKYLRKEINLETVNSNNNYNGNSDNSANNNSNSNKSRNNSRRWSTKIIDLHRRETICKKEKEITSNSLNPNLFCESKGESIKGTSISKENSQHIITEKSNIINEKI